MDRRRTQTLLWSSMLKPKFTRSRETVLGTQPENGENVWKRLAR